MLPRCITLAYFIYLLLPLALLLLGSLGQTWMNTLLPSGLTARWYAEVAADPSFRRAFSSSLLVAAATCAISLAIGLPLVQAIRLSRQSWWRISARLLTLVPVALPPLVLAFGYVRAFSSDALPWLGTTHVLVAGHVVLALPYFVQTVLSDSERLGLARLEEAAESLGATGMQRFFQVVLPALSHSVLAALIIVAALSIGEFQFSNLVAGFLNRTYPVVLLQAFYGATGFACAATVVLLALALLASLASALAARSAGPANALAVAR
jgi:putative spermidine/putrescine transport system permease protein